jgi:hypothetical protein
MIPSQVIIANNAKPNKPRVGVYEHDPASDNQKKQTMRNQINRKGGGA